MIIVKVMIPIAFSITNEYLDIIYTFISTPHYNVMPTIYGVQARTILQTEDFTQTIKLLVRIQIPLY